MPKFKALQTLIARQFLPRRRRDNEFKDATLPEQINNVSLLIAKF